MLEKQALAADIRHLSDDLIVQYRVISAFAAQLGLDTSLHTKTTNTANSYATQVGSGFDNVTTRVFQDASTTLDLSLG